MDARCDLLCVAPHPDDAEIALGGTLRLLADRGRRVWICDLTRGELATNADPETRWHEALAASEVLGLAGRVQLALPDGFIEPTARDQVVAVVHVLRVLCPAWVLTAPAPLRHPDHLASPALVRRAAFLSRLPALRIAAPPARWWPAPPPDPAVDAWIPAVVGHTCTEGREPDLLFDVTQTWSAKHDALACYRSQFRRDEGRAPTYINDPAFLDGIDGIGSRWGRRARASWAEAVRLEARLAVTDLPAGRWT